MSSEVVPVEVIRQRFQKYDVRNSKDEICPHVLYPHLQRASVLVPIFSKNGRWHVLLTIRSGMLRVHTGNVAFPGGLRDQSDVDEVDTALREAEEEIGLSRHDVTVLAVFQHTFVLPRYIVSPVIGVIPDNFVAKPNPNEISSVFDLPLDTFFNKADKQLWVGFGVEGFTPLFRCFVNDIKIHVWGFTAVTCLLAACVTYDVGRKAALEEGSFGIVDDVFAELRFSFHHYSQNIKSRM
ncbi:peroxisomal coenzyme A diphosphatase NUDT7-like isoform X2 [Gigantopelta aegis]|uniref:peroxisomal coenzyme A diphosphatase NUDT7-like isoform X2 n=1 Tax=Gigantopelta aegis TaxID=1735272 RepID=UPI001B88A0FC|nr:peroxisomal coenzyme A diphosphatase NUDT7-like isoform X2 [Gigantopelta aegis]